MRSPRVGAEAARCPSTAPHTEGQRACGPGSGCLYLGRALAARQLAAHALEVLVLFYAAGVLLEDLGDLEVRVHARRGEREDNDDVEVPVRPLRVLNDTLLVLKVLQYTIPNFCR